MDEDDLWRSRKTYWVPSTVRKGNCGRIFLITDDQEFCIEVKRQHPLLQDGMPVEIAALIDGEMAVRKWDVE